MSLLKKIEQYQSQVPQIPELSGDHVFSLSNSTQSSITRNTTQPKVLPAELDDSTSYIEEWRNKTDLSDEDFMKSQEKILDFMREESQDIELMSKEDLRIYLVDLIKNKDSKGEIKDNNIYPLVNSLVDDIKDYGPIQEYMNNPEVSDVRIIGNKCVKYKIRGRYYTSEKPEHRFRSEEHLHSWINRKIGLSRMGGRFDKGLARANALLLDGSRLHAITTVSGVGEWRDDKCIPTPYTIVSIRKFNKRFQVDELVDTTYQLDKDRISERNDWINNYEGLSAEQISQEKNRFMNRLMAAYMDLVCRLRFTILFGGGMGTGKTTTMNALFEFIPDYHVCGLVEETPEMQPDHEEAIRLWERPANLEGEGAITIKDLLKEILRMDVDRFFISELRDAIAYLFLQGIINGHPGGMSTLHANSARAMLLRLITLACSYPGSSRNDVLEMIAEGVQTFVHIEKTDDGDKYIGEIAEVEELIGDKITLRSIFTVDFDENGDWKWKYHGLSDRVICEAKKRRIAIPSILLESIS